MRYYRITLGIFLHILTNAGEKKDFILKHYYTDNKNTLGNSCSTEE